MKKKIIVTALLAAMILSTAVSMAASKSEEILVYKSEAKMYADCEEVQLSPAPFVCEGTTYLPIRAVSQVLGEKVTYNATTKAIYIGAQPGESLYMTETLKPSAQLRGELYRLDYINKLEMYGDKYDTAITINQNGEMEFNLDGKYEELTADLGIFRRTNDNAIVPVLIYRDDKLYDTYFLLGNANDPKEIKVPLKGVKKLLIQLDNWDNGIGDVALGDPMIILAAPAE